MSFTLLLGLLLAAQTPALVRINELTTHSSFSTVRIHGVLEQNARQLDNGAVFLLVNDGSGTLAVFCEDEDADETIWAGSVVEVSGSVIVDAKGRRRMRVHSNEGVVVLENPDRFGRSIASISKADSGCMKSVQGRIIRLWSPPEQSNAPHIIVIRDCSGVLTIVHWLDGIPSLQMGDSIEVSGRVGFYKEKLQLKLMSSDGLHLL